MHYPQSAVGLGYLSLPAGPTSAGAAVTADAVAHTKGTYVEMTASLGFTCNRVRLTQTSGPSASRLFLADIATGAGGSETVIVANVVLENPTTGSTSGVGSVDLPLQIASGARVALRCQSSTGGAQMRLALTLSAAGDTPSPTAYTSYGAVTGTTRGTSVDSGGTANVKGAYTQLTASSSAIAQVLAMVYSLAGNAAATVNNWALDLATGAGGAEVVLVPDLRTTCGVASVMAPKSETLWTYIPASTRIAVRASSSITDATDRLLDVQILTAVAPVESGGGGAHATCFIG